LPRYGQITSNIQTMITPVEPSLVCSFKNAVMKHFGPVLAKHVDENAIKIEIEELLKSCPTIIYENKNYERELHPYEPLIWGPFGAPPAFGASTPPTFGASAFGASPIFGALPPVLKRSSSKLITIVYENFFQGLTSESFHEDIDEILVYDYLRERASRKYNSHKSVRAVTLEYIKAAQKEVVGSLLADALNHPKHNSQLVNIIESRIDCKLYEGVTLSTYDEHVNDLITSEDGGEDDINSIIEQVGHTLTKTIYDQLSKSPCNFEKFENALDKTVIHKYLRDRATARWFY
jgi:hypothetical protein